MSTEGKQNATLALAGVAAVGAAVAALRMKTAQGAPGTLKLDQATLDLLAAIGIAVSDIDLSMAKLDEILAALTQGGSTPGQGWPANSPGFRANTIPLGAINTAYNLPAFPVPSGFTVMVKGYPTNVGLIFVAEDSNSALNVPIPLVGNGGSVWPLLPNEGVGLQVQNVNDIWVSTATAGDMVSWIVER
jgi:hypothetical protein